MFSRERGQGKEELPMPKFSDEIAEKVRAGDYSVYPEKIEYTAERSGLIKITSLYELRIEVRDPKMGRIQVSFHEGRFPNRKQAKSFGERMIENWLEKEGK